jgi:hypothetical protein
LVSFFAFESDVDAPGALEVPPFESGFSDFDPSALSVDAAAFPLSEPDDDFLA